jgi:beta-N-acetylhexosaminidase
MSGFEFGQLLTIGIEGKELTKDEEQFIIDNNIGGVILFTRNIDSPEQLWELTRSIHRCRLKQNDLAPLTISIDMEGGRVHRLKPPFTQYPALQHLGNIDSPKVAFTFANQMAKELAAFAINLDYAPCLDVLTNPDNHLIGDRSISTDPNKVAAIGSALIRGYIKGGVLTCGKHFPGHGETIIDSHDDLPVENLDLDRLNSTELVPFNKAVRSKVDMIMTAHMKFPKIDEEPVTFSKKFIQDILKDEMRYRGFVISDDLDMKALTNHYDKAEIPLMALEAGCDLLLYCNEPDSHKLGVEVITKAVESGRLKKEDLLARSQRFSTFKKEKLATDQVIPLEDALDHAGKAQRLCDAIKAEDVPDALIEEFS